MRRGPAPAETVDRPDPDDSRGPRHLALKTFLCAFVILCGITVLWSFSVPMASAPDESTHMVKAAAVVRGEWLGTQGKGKASAQMTVIVPATYKHTFGNFVCYRFKRDQSASCAPKIVASSKPVKANIRVGRYPPLYYLLVGWPSLLSTAASTLRWMRVLSAIVNSAALAMAFALVRRFRLGIGLFAGLVCALTPVVLYMASTVQPNGLEVSLAALLWTSLLGIYVWDKREPGSRRPPTMLLTTACVSASLLVLVRPLSPLWLAGIVVGSAILVERRHWLTWLSNMTVRIWSAVVAVASALALAWIAGAHALDTQPWTVDKYAHSSLIQQIQAVYGRSGRFLVQMEALVTRSAGPPKGAYVAAFVLFGLLIVVGLIRGNWRERLVLSLSTLGVFITPFVLAVPRMTTYGITWQGRYLIPFAVGIPMIAGMAALDTGRPASAVWRRIAARIFVVGSLATVGIAYWSEVRRYTVGNDGPLDLLRLTHPSWSPLLPVPVVVGATTGLLVVFALWSFALLTRCGRPLPETQAGDEPSDAPSLVSAAHSS